MSKAELNRQISTRKKTVAAASTVITLIVVWLIFKFLPLSTAWLAVAAYIYIDQYLTLKRLGDNPIP